LDINSGILNNAGTSSIGAVITDLVEINTSAYLGINQVKSNSINNTCALPAGDGIPINSDNRDGSGPITWGGALGWDIIFS
jgi:hypothetical protein